MQYGTSIGLQHFFVVEQFTFYCVSSSSSASSSSNNTQMMFILLLTQQKFELISKSNCIVIYFTKNYVFHIQLQTTVTFGLNVVRTECNSTLKCRIQTHMHTLNRLRESALQSQADTTI